MFCVFVQTYLLVLACSSWKQVEKSSADMCTQASIPWYHTNPSLSATAAIRLYHAWVDKQMVMKCTGHHSVESIWTYKQTTKQQCAATLDTSISNHKKPCLESSDHTEVQVAHTNHSLSLNDTYWYLRLMLSLSTSAHAVLILTAITRVLLITVPLHCIVYTICNFIKTNWKLPER